MRSSTLTGNNARALFELDNEDSGILRYLSGQASKLPRLTQKVGGSLKESFFRAVRVLASAEGPPSRVRLANHSDPSRQSLLVSLRILCISDTHNAHLSIDPESVDLLIHAGDLTEAGTEAELWDTLGWLDSLPIPHKVFIGGNHDFALEQLSVEVLRRRYPSLIYLNEDYATIEFNGREISLFGTPRSPRYGGFTAFSYRSGEQPFDSIARPCDIFISHGPPYGYVDNLPHKHAGCKQLLATIQELRPHLVVCGHIHVAGGSAKVVVLDELERCRRDNAWFSAWRGMLSGLLCPTNAKKTMFVNAAIADSSTAKLGMHLEYDLDW